MDIAMVSPIDHFKTRRKRSPSFPWRPVALVPTARFCGEIIFPRTPPEELAPTVRLGLRLSCWAVTFCKLANRAFEEVSEPVRATPSHPMIGAKNGNRKPVAAAARPRVKVMPAELSRNPGPRTETMVRMAHLSWLRDSP